MLPPATTCHSASEHSHPTPHQQEEQYNHLDELEMTRVDKQLNDAMLWMNGKMNQQNSQDLTLDPVVRVAEIQAKTKVERERDHTAAFHQSSPGAANTGPTLSSPCKHRANFEFSSNPEGYYGMLLVGLTLNTSLDKPKRETTFSTHLF